MCADKARGFRPGKLQLHSLIIKLNCIKIIGASLKLFEIEALKIMYSNKFCLIFRENAQVNTTNAVTNRLAFGDLTTIDNMSVKSF